MLSGIDTPRPPPPSFGDAPLDPLTGVLTWTPTEAQGPSTTVITVQVTDNGTPPLSASRTFTVNVAEVNSPPALAVVFDLDDVAVGCRLGKAQNGTLIDPGMTGNDAVRLAGSQ